MDVAWRDYGNILMAYPFLFQSLKNPLDLFMLSCCSYN